MTDDDLTAADAALFARLRAVWTDVDPVPAELVDRMVAAVAVADLSREYEMLTLVETAGVGAVRGESDTLTLQFSDGQVSVLLHVSAEDDELHRVDGWIDPAPRSVTLVQEGRDDRSATVADGRFAFEGVRAGFTGLRFAVTGSDGAPQRRETPRFEV